MHFIRAHKSVTINNGEKTEYGRKKEATAAEEEPWVNDRCRWATPDETTAWHKFEEVGGVDEAGIRNSMQRVGQGWEAKRWHSGWIQQWRRGQEG